MSQLVDVRWLAILPLGPTLVFVLWVFWNLSREIWAEKRRWIRTYRDSYVEITHPESRSTAVYVSRRQQGRTTS
jgi:hypothetical protein